MINEAFGTGATTEEAIAEAKKALNAPDGAEIKYEITKQATKKLLGLFGGTPAEVRAYYEVSCVDIAVKYILNILKGMGMENAKAEAKLVDGDIIVDLDCGDDYGIVIGRRGETLDAIQYLTRLVINRGSDDYLRVSINVGDYREKREKTLRSLAHRNAVKVAKFGRNVTLEPMNPFERRIIHTAVQDIEGVTSHSVGADAERRVVITLKEGVKPTHQSKAPYNKNGNKGGYKGKSGNKGGKGGYKGKGGFKKEPYIPSGESRAPRSDAGAQGVSRYGKIN